ncbi:hypothetical protein MKEN_00573600 [Mycena kentingensis (nom. inval.)]|nr:hypothetical protein MKEN_00573600 [Mycena kentingensis (nom. inval.)]
MTSLAIHIHLNLPGVRIVNYNRSKEESREQRSRGRDDRRRRRRLGTGSTLHHRHDGAWLAYFVSLVVLHGQVPRLPTSSTVHSTLPHSPWSRTGPRKKRTEPERIAYLRADRHVARFEPYRVLCGSCDKWIRLRSNSTYCSTPWDTHRKICLEKKAATVADSAHGQPFPSLTSHRPIILPRTSRANVPLKNAPPYSAPDVLIREVHPNRVFCLLCSNWINLRRQSSYCIYPWLQHRARCIAKYQRGNAKQTPGKRVNGTGVDGAEVLEQTLRSQVGSCGRERYDERHPAADSDAETDRDHQEAAEDFDAEGEPRVKEVEVQTVVAHGRKICPVDLDTPAGRLNFICGSVQYLYSSTHGPGDELTICALLIYLNASIPPDKHEEFDTREVARGGRCFEPYFGQSFRGCALSSSSRFTILFAALHPTLVRNLVPSPQTPPSARKQRRRYPRTRLPSYGLCAVRDALYVPETRVTLAAWLLRSTCILLKPALTDFVEATNRFTKRIDTLAAGTSSTTSQQTSLRMANPNSTTEENAFNFISKHRPALFKDHVGELVKVISEEKVREKRPRLVEVALKARGEMVKTDETMVVLDMLAIERTQLLEGTSRPAKLAGKIQVAPRACFGNIVEDKSRINPVSSDTKPNLFSGLIVSRVCSFLEFAIHDPLRGVASYARSSGGVIREPDYLPTVFAPSGTLSTSRKRVTLAAWLLRSTCILLKPALALLFAPLPAFPIVPACNLRACPGHIVEDKSQINHSSRRCCPLAEKPTPILLPDVLYVQETLASLTFIPRCSSGPSVRQCLDPARAVEDLDAFAKLRRAAAILLRTCADPQTDFVEATNRFTKRIDTLAAGTSSTTSQQTSLRMANPNSTTEENAFNFISKHRPALFKDHVGELVKVISEEKVREKRPRLVEVALKARGEMVKTDETMVVLDMLAIERTQLLEGTSRPAKLAGKIQVAPRACFGNIVEDKSRINPVSSDTKPNLCADCV